MTRRATVLAYHAVGEPPGENPYNLFLPTRRFERQMAFLARRRRVVTLEDALQRRFSGGPPAVAITFDDAYRNVLTNAVPILVRHGFPATMFVPTAWLGRPPGWLDGEGHGLVVMDEDELRRAEQLGVSVESHGHVHAHLPALSDEDVRTDVETSTERIQAVIGRRPRYFAYPFGDVSSRVGAIVADAGYAAALSIDRPGTDPFAWERTQIAPLDSPAMFALKTTGRYLGLRHARATSAAYDVVKPLVSRLRASRSGGAADRSAGSQSSGE